MVDSKFKKYFVLIGTGIAALIVCADFTVVATVLPIIQKELGFTIAQLQWVMAAFGLFFASCLVAAGKLGDTYGRRRCIYIGVIGFAVVSFLAGISHQPLQLIVCRCFQGLFAAVVVPSGMALTAHAFSKKARGKAIASFVAIVGFGLALGPVVGGWVTSFFAWRWIFFMNVPLAAISLLICLSWVDESSMNEKVKIDWLGMFTLMFLLICLVYSITQAPISGWFSPLTLVSLLLGLTGIVFFVWIEKHAVAPLMPITLIANANFILACMINVVAVGFSFMVLFILPLYLRTIVGLPAGKIGSLVFPMTAMTFFMPFVGGVWLDKQGRYPVAFMIVILVVMAFLLFSFFSLSSSLLFVVLSSVIFGLGWGLANGAGIPIGLLHMPQDHVAVASGAQITVLNVFGVMALAAGGALLHHLMNSRLSSLLSQAGLKFTKAQVHQLITSSLSVTGTAQRVPAQLSHQISLYIKDAFLFGFRGAAIMFVILSTILLFGVCIMFKKRKTTTYSKNSK
jgi:EmrB/QacA subfamily drug resistance transporter